MILPGPVFPLSPQQTLHPPSDLRTGLYHANFADVQMDELNLEKAYSIGESVMSDDSDDRNYDVLCRLLQADVLPRGSLQAVRALLASRILATCDS